MTDMALETPKRMVQPSRLRRLVRWLAGDLRAALAILVLLVLVIVAIGAPWIAPYLPTAQDANNMLAATVVIEAVFAIPGLGSLIVRGAIQRDFPIVQGVVFAMVIVVILVNLIADLMCAAVDPRIEQ